MNEAPRRYNVIRKYTSYNKAEPKYLIICVGEEGLCSRVDYVLEVCSRLVGRMGDLTSGSNMFLCSTH